MRSSTAKTVFITLVVGSAVAAAAAAAAIYSGIVNVAASEVDPPLMAFVLHLASDRSVAVRMADNKVPTNMDQPQFIAAGAKLFGKNCVVCHGGPGLAPSAVARGLNPAPVNLFREGRDAASNETFWFIKNGVRMTGMPSFGKTYSDDEIWSLAAFLKLAPGMSAQDFTAKTGVTSPSPSSKPASG